MQLSLQQPCQVPGWVFVSVGTALSGVSGLGANSGQPYSFHSQFTKCYSESFVLFPSGLAWLPHYLQLQHKSRQYLVASDDDGICCVLLTDQQLG